MVRSATLQRAVPVIRLLLVEDGQSDAYMVESLLDEIGGTRYETHHVRNGADALSALAEERFDVCLLDLKLPGTNGFGTLIDIQEKAPSMPVLILTGVNDTLLAKRAVSRGAQDFLQKDDLEKSALARSIDHAIERKRSEKVLFLRANHDSLTGLANRSMLERHMERAIAHAARSGSIITVMFIDLDQFKTINDTYGHDAGDEILKNAAERLRGALRAYDTPARLGGDEFAVLLEDIEKPRDAACIAQKIIQAINQPVPYNGKNLQPHASIGIVFSQSGPIASTLIQQADTAMYHAKKDGGNTFRFYVPAMQDATRMRLKLEEDIKKALITNELRLLYQPYITPGGEAIIGVEGLLRWAKPGQGLLLPGDFLSAADAANLMPEIGMWTGKQLCSDIAMWNQHGLPPLEIAINLSGSQLEDPALIDWMFVITQKNTLGEHSLAVEISESDVLSLTDTQIKALGTLHTLGVKLHLDHFGKNALSLQALHSLPFSLLKMDTSLIRTMNDKKTGDAIISAAILLAHHLGIKVSATGVETQAQIHTLVARKCDAVQGFLTASPMTAEEIRQWLKSKKQLKWH